MLKTTLKKKRIIKKDTLTYLNNLLRNFKVKSSSELPRMSSMLVGYFSYDTDGRCFEFSVMLS